MPAASFTMVPLQGVTRLQHTRQRPRLPVGLSVARVPKPCQSAKRVSTGKTLLVAGRALGAAPAPHAVPPGAEGASPASSERSRGLAGCAPIAPARRLARTTALPQCLIL